MGPQCACRKGGEGSVESIRARASSALERKAYARCAGGLGGDTAPAYPDTREKLSRMLLGRHNMKAEPGNGARDMGNASCLGDTKGQNSQYGKFRRSQCQDREEKEADDEAYGSPNVARAKNQYTVPPAHYGI